MYDQSDIEVTADDGFDASPAASESHDFTNPAKRRRKTARRQLISCDACRLRRVKCDRSGPDTEKCEACARKGVRCTSEYIKTKPKIDRSGKLIKQAKAIFGVGEDAPKELQARPRPEVAWNAYVTKKGISKLGNDPERFAVTEHLLEKYHKIVHRQFAVLDWKPFAAMFKRIGSERDTPSTFLCTVAMIETWAAMFTDHPFVLRFHKEDGPQLSNLDTYTGVSLCFAGENRDKFVREHVQYALRLVHSSELITEPPSAFSASTLVLASMLCAWGDETEHRRRRYLSAAVDHIRTLRDLSPPHDIPEGGNLFWFTLIQDARGATASGRKFFITSDDVVDLCPTAGRLRQDDVASPANIAHANIAHGDLEDVICALHLQVIDAMRLFTLEVTGPVKRRYTIDIEAVVKLWEMIEASVQSTEAFKANMQRSKSSHWQASLRDITSARVLLAYFLYKNLSNRFALEETEAIRGVAFVEAEDEEYLELLRNLIVEAERKLLHLIKDFTSQLRGLGPLVSIRAAIAAESYHLFGHFILQLPTSEEGGSIQTWDLQAKLDEVERTAEVVGLLGWSSILYSSQLKFFRYAIADLKRRRARFAADLPTASPPAPAVRTLNTSDSHRYPPAKESTLHSASGRPRQSDRSRNYGAVESFERTQVDPPPSYDSSFSPEPVPGASSRSDASSSTLGKTYHPPPPPHPTRVPALPPPFHFQGPPSSDIQVSQSGSAMYSTRRQ